MPRWPRQGNQLAAFRESGDLQPTGETHAVAQRYANMNNDYLARQDIWPRVRSIRVNAANNTVYVSAEADLSVMFPSIVPQLIVEEGGEGVGQGFQEVDCLAYTQNVEYLCSFFVRRAFRFEFPNALLYISTTSQNK